ncbi:MAG: MBL fold metallo-hydrolase, partial [Firmicutes bacterium]|nr:MBL fold metallo-hydrolase [Bacillota bacterium]
MIEEITINTHSSIRIRGDRVIYFDPFQITEEVHDADVIFITHDHYDHFDPASIEKILKDDTMMVIPKTCFESWSDSGLIVTQVIQMDPEEKIDMGGILIETVPAYNHLKPFHPKKKKWLGYLVTLEDRRIYVAGDTDVTEESRQVRCDIALVPVGGKYTMNAAKAAELINEIEPEIAVPTHYGNIVGK